MKYLITAVTTGLFVWLAYASLHRQATPEQANAFVARKVAEYRPPTEEQRRAKAYAEIYNITNEDLSKPVNLWGSK